MPLLAPITGENALLSYMLNKSAAGNTVLHLYTNSVTINSATTLASFTELTGSGGYTAVTMIPGNWTMVTTASPVIAQYIQVSWTLSVAATILGYYVTDAANSVLLWCEAFTGGAIVVPPGGTFNLTPIVNLL